MELGTSEDSRMVFSIKRTPMVFNIEPTISNIQIRVSNIPQFSSISIIPTMTNHMTAHQNLKTNPASHTKKFLSWDCGGTGDLKFMQAMKGLIQLHKPSIVVLIDPKACGANAYGIIKEIGFSAGPTGLTYGIWVLWQEEDVDVEVTSSAPYQINASVQVFPEACNNPSMGCPMEYMTILSHFLNLPAQVSFILQRNLFTHQPQNGFFWVRRVRQNRFSFRLKSTGFCASIRPHILKVYIEGGKLLETPGAIYTKSLVGRVWKVLEMPRDVHTSLHYGGRQWEESKAF
ncbi:hypothetical protein CK203_024647 [Vitis vinifera]|uniref:Uncharacterized protein n=1 Tax=Vitis vinifera TaxID=29760 RepID=A0A438IUK9_VITVI|nr:hypothetical protein CK203_024647 [Vitis vinifera]